MLTKLMLTLSLVSAMSTSALACTEDGSTGIVPENDMYISVNAKSMRNTDITKEVFNQIIDKVANVYAPIIRDQGGNLDVQRNWDDGTVNAYASRNGNTWIVSMFGGLARHETVTKDGFALVVCHEVGHHIGGAPKKSTGWFGGLRWASNEGQADYFATLKCLRKVFENDDNQAVLAQMNVPQVVVEKCAAQFANENEQLICQRSSMAGMSVSRLFQALRNQDVAPDFTTPDANVVSKTDHNHPQTQCRLDTYFAGAICPVDVRVEVNQSEEAEGVCYAADGHQVGTRPLCWFKSKR